MEKPLIVSNDQYGKVNYGQDNYQGSSKVSCKAQSLFELDADREPRVMPDPFEHLEADLYQTLSPPFLLGLEGVKLYW